MIPDEIRGFAELWALYNRSDAARDALSGRFVLRGLFDCPEVRRNLIFKKELKMEEISEETLRNM